MQSKLSTVRAFTKKKSPYSRIKMQHTLQDASRTRTDEEFSSFQLDWINKHLPGMKGDAISVIYCQMDGNQMIAGTHKNAYINMPANELDIYRSVQHLDVIRLAALRNIGTAIFNTDFYSLKAWPEQPMYKGYYETLGLLQTVSVAYAIPFHNNLRFQFTYFKAKGSEFEKNLTKDEIEYLSIPFYYLWAQRWGIIDEGTCQRWLHLMSGMNPTQLFLLRDLIAQPRYSLSLIAKNFQINPRMVNHFYIQCYDKILDALETKNQIEGNASKIVDLAQAFNFLQFVGGYRPRN